LWDARSSGAAGSETSMICRPESSSVTYAIPPTTLTFSARSGVSYDPKSVGAEGSETSRIRRPDSAAVTYAISPTTLTPHT
jgi:hypothetical protein